MFGAFGKALTATSVTFVSEAALSRGVGDLLSLDKQMVAVSGTRNVTKADMCLNTYAPSIEVSPETYEVRADGVLLTCEPAAVLPLAQRYFLF